LNDFHNIIYFLGGALSLLVKFSFFLRINKITYEEVSTRLYKKIDSSFPEMLNSGVKTLHPKIRREILAKRTPEHLKQLLKQVVQ